MTKGTNTIWVLTREHNAYDQHGSYFVTWFSKKPSVAELAPYLSKEVLLPNDIGEAIKYTQDVIDGKGRKGHEEAWCSLDCVEESKSI